MRTTDLRKGVTLVETILASVILCRAGRAPGAISTRALGQSNLNRQYETAASLADQQLAMIDYMGVEDFILAGQTEGWYQGPNQQYRWVVATRSEGIDSLYTVQVTIAWVGSRRVHSVSVQTRLNGTGGTVELVGL